MANSEQLGAALAQAEGALARAVIGSADISAGWAEINRKLDKVRPHCRQLRAALFEPDGSETIASIGKANTHCRELRVVFLELNPAATTPFLCDLPSCPLLHSPRTTCWINHLDGMIATRDLLETSANKLISAPAPSPTQAIQRSSALVSTQERIRPVARPTRSLLRQTIDLFVLVVAYLLYFFIDVQLQIVMLPSIFP